MPSEQSRQWLIEIRDNARLAQSFIAGKTHAEFQADRQLFYAVARCLEIVSEASRRLEDEMRQRATRRRALTQIRSRRDLGRNAPPDRRRICKVTAKPPKKSAAR
jgi:uncharacterized protein with HEPN domain